MARSMSTLVVGAGVTGLGAALLLARRGFAVEVWEGSSDAGGLLAPVPFRGVDCDRGSHRVHPGAHPALWKITPRERWLERKRLGRLILGGRAVPYPPHALGVLSGLGPRAALEMGGDFLLRRSRWRRFVNWEAERRAPAVESDEGFEAFVRARVGESSYQRFYRPYVEKVWGAPPAELSRSVAKQRLSIESPLTALARAAFRDPPRFLYPARGMSSVIADLRAELSRLGVEIRYETPATLDSLERAPHDAILHSGHLSDLLPDAGLEHRGLYLLHLAVDQASASEEDTFYAPDSELWFGRVSRIDRFSPALARPGEAILCVEIPEGRLGAGRDFLPEIDAVLDQLQRVRILKRRARLFEARQTYVPRVYPLYLRGWWTRWSAALSRLCASEPRLLPIGRQGLFLHCNLDQCAAIAAAAVEHLVSGQNATAWAQRAASFLELRVRD